MDRIREILARLANPESIPADELLATRLELAEAFDEWFATGEFESDEGAALAAEVGTIAEAADKRISEIEEVRAARRAEAEKLRTLVSPKAEGPEDDETPDGEGDTGDPVGGGGEDVPETVPAETPPETADESAPELVTAAAAPRVPLSLIAARQPQSTKPAVVEPRGPIVTAGVDLNAFSANQELTVDEAAEAMLEKLDAARMADPDSPPSIMRAGKVSWGHQYPEDRVLKAKAPEVNDRRITAVVGEYPGDPRAIVPPSGNGLTATGGICAPVAVRYELETVATADRPLRAGLTSFNADRGGIQFNGPAHLVDILGDTTSAALTTITAANDAAAVGKTVQEVACGALTTVQVRAIAERLQFSNFADRYNPERMKQFMQLARAAHSRLAERLLLEDIRTSSTLVNGGALWVGATRQWFGNLLAGAAGMRYRNRMDDAYPLRAIMPAWFKTLVAIDLGLQSNGEQTVTHQSWQAEQVINAWCAEGNIRPIFQRDDARTNDAQGAGAPAFGSQTGNGAALNDFPGRMSTILFPEGSFLFLDGGSLDFGIVRDSTLNAANRFQTFYETFEGVAFVGVESLNISTAICASGQGIAGTTTTKCGGVGS